MLYTASEKHHVGPILLLLWCCGVFFHCVYFTIFKRLRDHVSLSKGLCTAVWVKNRGPYHVKSLGGCSLWQRAGGPVDFLLSGSSALAVSGRWAVQSSSYQDFSVFWRFPCWCYCSGFRSRKRPAEIFRFQIIDLCSCCSWEILALLHTTAGQWELENASKRLKDGTFFSFRISWLFSVRHALFIPPWCLHNLI